MRRKDREVTELTEIISIINKCDVCRLGMVDADNGKPYVVPMNFGYEFNGADLTLYFHGAKEGKKIDILRCSSYVCFEMDCRNELVTGDESKACTYSYKYESVIGYGNAVFVEEYDEKIYALNKIMAHYTENNSYTFSPNEVGAVEIIKILADEYTAKRH